MATFAFFWEQSKAFNRGCPWVVFSFKLPQRLGEGRSRYTMWHDLQSVSRTVAAAESATLPESTVAMLGKDKKQKFHIKWFKIFWPNVRVVVTENCHYGGLSKSQMLCCHSKALTTPSDGLLISSHQSHIDFPFAAVFINKNFKPNTPPLPRPALCVSAFSLKEEFRAQKVYK